MLIVSLTNFYIYKNFLRVSFKRKVYNNRDMNIAIVLAAGQSQRMKLTGKPKQFLKVFDIPLFIYSLKEFDNNPRVDKIILVTSKEYVKEAASEAKHYGIKKLHEVVVGGDTRQESVYHALRDIRGYAKDDDIVLIHDSARPLLNQRIINDNIDEALKNDAAMTIVLPNDTIITGKDDEYLDKTLNRDELFIVQTPQSFKYSLILKAHEEAIKDGTKNALDDASLVKRIGHEVKFVKGDKNNIKVTTQEDLEMVALLIQMNKK